MTDRTLRRLGWLTLGSSALATVAEGAVSVAAGSRVDPFELAVLAFPFVGALIVHRQARNRIGWVLLAIGGAFVPFGLLNAYAAYGLQLDPGSLPRPDIALALAAPGWIPFIVLSGTFLILLFPDGRLPSPRWRGWAWLCAIVMTVSSAWILVLPGPLEESGNREIANPLAVDALRPVAGAVFAVIALIPVSIVGCAAALVMRFRRSHGQERLQLKWLALGAGATATLYLVSMAASLTKDSPWGAEPGWLVLLQSVAVYSFLLIPIAIGIAILRHRLYDIDLIVNRALVYGALTATLALSYLGGVLLLQQLFAPLTRGSDLAIAGSTLAVAALFRPLRGRIQAAVDRRFFRARYDAARIVESFSARLRDRVDLDELGSDLRTVVSETMQPAHVSLWLRGGEARADHEPTGRASSRPGSPTPLSRAAQR